MSGISFSFTKTKGKPSLPGKPVLNLNLGDEPEKKAEDKEFIVAIDDKTIQSTKPSAEKKEYIIPLIQNNNWRLESLRKRNGHDPSAIKQESDDDDGGTTGDGRPIVHDIPVPIYIKKEHVDETLDQKAARELLAEAGSFSTTSSAPTNTRVIPILMRNKVPDGFETDQKLDVSLRPEGPSAADYDAIPVEEFGMAMLRGMGFKADASKASLIQEPKIRAKGLGLGADVTASTISSSSSSSSSSTVSNNKPCPPQRDPARSRHHPYK